MSITAAADGSALGNPGPAGWAWYVDENRWASGGWPHGTNNMGELTAVLDLLRQTADLSEELVVICDSTYAINSITKWMPGWKRKGWRKGDGQPVQNLDIMQALDEAMANRGGPVRFEWVKGHTGHDLNEAADRLANAAAMAFRDGIEPDGGPGMSPNADRVPTTQEAKVAVPEPDLFSLVDEGTTDEEHVIALERSLLTDAVRSDVTAVAALLHPEWSEIGSSGRTWGRDEMLGAIGPLSARVSCDVVSIERLSPDSILLIWRSVSDTGSALRSSLWQRVSGRWLQRFHQGTREV
ncbi:MAG: ribonuclease HI family protein [Marmoricola sp.]